MVKNNKSIIYKLNQAISIMEKLKERSWNNMQELTLENQRKNRKNPELDKTKFVKTTNSRILKLRTYI